MRRGSIFVLGASLCACAAQQVSAVPLAPVPVASASASQNSATPVVPPVKPVSVSPVVWAYQRACDLGSGRGCNDLGVKLLDGVGVAKDEKRAAELLERGCELKFATACANFGYLLEQGIGVHADREAALKVLEFSCSERVGVGCNLLGDAIHDRSPADARRALDLFKLACSLKSAAACANAGGMYDLGEFVKRDRSQAAVYYRQSCDASFGLGCTGLATLQLRGEGGLSADPSAARELYEKGCQLDPFHGCSTYGIILNNGELPDPGHERARAVLKLGCAAGNAESCSALGDVSGED